MPFTALDDAQQLEIVVAGPGDVSRLYVCKGMAQGYFDLNVAPGAFGSTSDTWQFEVGPDLSSTQFRRAIATVSFAGMRETEASGANVSWSVETVIADFDDDAGKARISATNYLSIWNPPSGTTPSVAGVTRLAYDVSILAAVT